MGRVFEIWKETHFEAAHQLNKVPPGHKCARLHGHSYKVRVFCAGELDKRGFVVDYAEIGTAMDRVVGRLDHRNLNDILAVETTAENLCVWIVEQIAKDPLIGQKVTAVEVYETPTTCVKLAL